MRARDQSSIFSSGRQFRPYCGLILELHALTLVACSYALLGRWSDIMSNMKMHSCYCTLVVTPSKFATRANERQLAPRLLPVYVTEKLIAIYCMRSNTAECKCSHFFSCSLSCFSASLLAFASILVRSLSALRASRCVLVSFTLWDWIACVHIYTCIMC